MLTINKLALSVIFIYSPLNIYLLPLYILEYRADGLTGLGITFLIHHPVDIRCLSGILVWTKPEVIMYKRVWFILEMLFTSKRMLKLP